MRTNSITVQIRRQSGISERNDSFVSITSLCELEGLPNDITNQEASPERDEKVSLDDINPEMNINKNTLSSMYFSEQQTSDYQDSSGSKS